MIQLWLSVSKNRLDCKALFTGSGACRRCGRTRPPVAASAT